MLEWWQNFPQALNPIAFSLGFFSVYWYAIFVLWGFLAALLFALWLAHRGAAPCSAECVFDLFLFVFLGALLGGRIGYAIFYNLDVFLETPSRIFLPYDFVSKTLVGISGMSYHGGLIGVTLALLWFTRVPARNASRQKRDAGGGKKYYQRPDVAFWETADFVAFLAPIATFFGRLGNFFNLELYGRITERPWGMIFHTSLPVGVLRHPSALYEAFLEGLILFILMLLLRKKHLLPGGLACSYLSFYAVLRFLAEFWREPDPQLGLFFSSLAGGFTLGQLLSLGMLGVACIIFLWLKYKNYVTMAQGT
jgi:phosphatidylglycerol:prolipoprotein diacylglycerol transferase